MTTERLQAWVRHQQMFNGSSNSGSVDEPQESCLSEVKECLQILSLLDAQVNLKEEIRKDLRNIMEVKLSDICSRELKKPYMPKEVVIKELRFITRSNDTKNLGKPKFDGEEDEPTTPPVTLPTDQCASHQCEPSVGVTPVRHYF
jgi:hypothetical protein